MGEVISFDDAKFPAPTLVIDISADPAVVAAQIVGQFPAQRNDENEKAIIARFIAELQAMIAITAAEYSKACVERDELKRQLAACT